MAATIENLIGDLERSYTELQERMSDSSVYNDQREAADVGRRLKDLEPAYKLAQEWRTTRDDVVRKPPCLMKLRLWLAARAGTIGPAPPGTSGHAEDA